MISKSILFILVAFCVCSCAVNRKAGENADAFNKSMKEIRSEVYASVIAARNDTKIDAATKSKLQQQYSAVQEGFNKTLDEIIASVTSDDINKAKCVILNYKRVMAPYRSDFEKSAKLANDFNQAVVKARDIAGIGIKDVYTVIISILDALAKEKNRVCKENIESMKYKNWADIDNAH